MIGIMTEREHWTKKRGREKGKKGERERGRGRNRQENSKKDSLISNSHLNHKVNATCTSM